MSLSKERNTSNTLPVPVAITLAYDGAEFSGYARQEGQRTVQEEIESALEVMACKQVSTVVAGRTDAGVHAWGQVISCELPQALGSNTEKVRRSLQTLTPDDIVIRSVNVTETGFSARFDAVARHYVYRIAARETPPLFGRHYCWHVRSSLDVELMRRGAEYLIGEHDFASFCVAVSRAKLKEAGYSTRRNVKSISFESSVWCGQECLEIHVSGNAFLHSMVRVIVGSLVEVGRAKKSPSWIGEILAAKDRTVAGQTAPAQGLTLDRIDYH